MYIVKKIGVTDIKGLLAVSYILYKCGKDMAHKLDLHHWNNPYIKSFVIVCICSLKNSVYLVSNEKEKVATFQVRQQGEKLYFEKLATSPSDYGKGIGSFCMNQIEEIALKKGCKKVCMEVYSLSQHAIKFYEYHGYITNKVESTLKYKIIKMEKNL